MAMSPSRILIVGCGPGSAMYLTEAARQAVARAEVLAGSNRLLLLFADHPGPKIAIGGEMSLALEEIAAFHRAGRTAAVLVSGDPGFFSFARRVIERFGRENCEVVPGVSSVQVAFARLGLDWTDAKLLSAHGRTPDVVAAELSVHDKIAILAGSREAIQWCAHAADLVRAGHVTYLCENLSFDDERVRQITPEELRDSDAASLSIVLLIRRSLLS